MKKKSKKLVLNRETLVYLERNLEEVAGGVTKNPSLCGTGFSGYDTCATCGNTCGTNLC